MDVPKAIICADGNDAHVMMRICRKAMWYELYRLVTFNIEKDGHSSLLGGLINLLDGCAVRYFDQVVALRTGGTERRGLSVLPFGDVPSNKSERAHRGLEQYLGWVCRSELLELPLELLIWSFQKRQNIAATGGAAEHNSEQFSLGARHVGFSLATERLGVLSNLSTWCTQLKALILYKCMDFNSHGRFYCSGGSLAIRNLVKLSWC
ncbi:unnamed protein product [Prunus armeniaca]|uniref:Uncharacterized protein n=1 Tax=Prunus armeniaca TaxID=36596 RepID=A0A6J5WFD4_PRUAR|nr:unnamed protein product [Prunus armeniaca]